MYVDPEGSIAISAILMTMFVGAIIGAITSGIKAKNAGLDWGAVVLAALGGAIMGAAVSGAFLLGGVAATSGLTLFGHSVSVLTTFAVASYGTALAGMADYHLKSLAYGNETSVEGYVLSAINGFFEGATSFAAGFLAGVKGYFKYFDKGGLLNPRKTYEKISRYITFNLPSSIIRLLFKTAGQTSWGLNW